MAHMWFGNQITCPWWDELWINESFATYFALVGLEPDTNAGLNWTSESGVAGWDLDDNLITGRTVAALNADQTTNSNPIVNIHNRVEDAEPVKDHRNYGSSSIIYSKGGVVLSMARCMLSDKVFFGGLNDYLKKYEKGNPNSKNLFDSWDDYIADKSIKTDAAYTDQKDPLCGVIGKNEKQATLPAGKTANDVLDTWTRQMGYPFIRVNSNVEGDKTKLTLKQERFLTNPQEKQDQPPSSLGYKWHVPLAVQTSAGNSQLWLDATDKAQTFDLAKSDFAFVNNQFRSLVRVLYEDAAADNVQKQLSSNLDSVDTKTRAQIVFDYFAFAENSALTGVKVTDALDFTDFVRNDVDKTVWRLYADGIKYMRDIMKHTDDKSILDGYLNGVVAKMYAENDWSTDVSAIDDMKRVGMSISLVEACKYGNEDCLEHAEKAVSSFDPEKMTNEPDRDQKLAAYCYGVQQNKNHYDKLWNYYTVEQNANERSVLFSGMACSKDEATLTKYLQEALNDDVRVQDKHSVFNYVSGSDYGRDVAWNFIREDSTWDWLYEMMTEKSYRRVPSILTSVTKTFSTAALKSEVEAFEDTITKSGKIGSLKSTFENIYVQIDKNINWRSTNQQAIVDYIKEKNGDSGSSQVMASATLGAMLLLLN